MNIWGERFAEVELFIGYCRDLNVETDQRELEHYERIGAMLPVARVVYPDDYVIQRDQSQWNGTMDWDGTDQWPAIARLSERGGPFPLRIRRPDRQRTRSLLRSGNGSRKESAFDSAWLSQIPTLVRIPCSGPR